MTAKQSGQTLPLVALMLFCIVGMVALVIDGSSIYSQQRRMQADLDMAVKVSADELPNTSTAQTDGTNLLVQRGYTNPGITINVPPQTAPYMQKPCPSAVGSPCYAEGFLTQNVHSFFAGVLGLKVMKISVHAVAEKGGDDVQPPQLLALDNNPLDCGVNAQGSASGELNANVHSNSQTCRGKSNNMFADGNVVSVFPTSPNFCSPGGSGSNCPITGTLNVPFGDSGNGTGKYMSNPYNPNWTVPLTISAPMTSTTCTGSSPCVTSCSSIYSYHSVAPGVKYYQPDSTGVAVINNQVHVSGSNTDEFLPYCDPATGQPTFGIYLFTGSNGGLKIDASAEVDAYDSTFVFNYVGSAALSEQGGVLNMRGPCTDTTVPCNIQPCSVQVCPDPFYGSIDSIVMWQVNTPVPCTTPTGGILQGGGTGTIEGIVDLPCTNLTVTGNSTNPGWINGGLVAWEISINGTGSGLVTQSCYYYCSPKIPRGSVLVQ